MVEEFGDVFVVDFSYGCLFGFFVECLLVFGGVVVGLFLV